MAKATAVRGLTARASLRELGPRLLLARVGDVERYAPGLPGEDPVHDMRVACRRLRAALRLLHLRELEPPVKALQDALGQVRDLQLQIAWLKGRDDALAAKREKLLDRAMKALPRAVEEFRAHPLPPVKLHGKLGGGRIARILKKRHQRFDERVEKALQRPSAANMHAVRRSVKQLRYLHELVRFAEPGILRELEPLQAALGELHDTDVRIGLLRGRPDLLREQKEDRDRLAKIVAAELERFARRS
ncbi:MAG TPA: CHAD domain-containing protein [Myxococcales bacterium]|nr:CHAD domain-containing protein [Myxococcales bacterium]